MIHITELIFSYNQFFCTFFIVHEVVCRWVDTGVNLRVRPPQIEAHDLAFACQFAENVLQGGYSWGANS